VTAGTDTKEISSYLGFHQSLLLLWEWTNQFHSQNYTFNHIGYFLKWTWNVHLQELVDSYTLFLSSWQYHNMQTHTYSCTHVQKYTVGIFNEFKYHIVSEFINFYLLTATFSNIRNCIKRKHSGKKLISTSLLWDKTYYTLYTNEVVNWDQFKPVPQSDLILP
jgi:hypothetical protein